MFFFIGFASFLSACLFNFISFYSASLKIKSELEAHLRPSKNMFFDGITTFCLSPFGLPGGKTHGETARNGRECCGGSTAAAGIYGLRVATLNNPLDFFDRLKGAFSKRLSFFVAGSGPLGAGFCRMPR